MAVKRLRINWARSALVDDEDFERCKNIRWLIKKYYSYRNGRKVTAEHVYAPVTVNGVPGHLHLARLILDAQPGQRVRYVNNNHLDCRKCNLTLGGVRQDLPRYKGLPHGDVLEEIEKAIEEIISAPQLTEPSYAC